MANQNKIEIVLSAITAGFESRLNAAVTSVKGLGNAAQQAERGGLSVARKGVESISTSLERMKNMAIAAFSVSAIKNYAASFIATADAMRNMDQRLLLTAKNTADYAAAQKTVIDISKAAHQGITEVATLYTRMALATANLNVSQQQLADVTKTVALATALAESSAQESSAGLLQFAQAMGSGKLQGDELRSVLENMPLLTKVFVDAAGGSIAKLREMATSGELTTQWMIDAITKAKDSIEKQAAAMPKTVGRSMTDLRNETAKYIDSVNQATGFTETFASGIDYLGQHLDAVAKGGAMVLGTALSVLVARGLIAVQAAIPAVIASLVRLTAASAASSVALSSAASYMSGSYTAAAATAAATTGTRLIPALLGMINPIGAVITILGACATAWTIWGNHATSAVDQTTKKLEELKRANQLMKEIADPGIKLKAAEQDVTASKEKIAQLEAEVKEANDHAALIDAIHLGERLDEEKELLAKREELYKQTQENIKLSSEQRGAKEIAVEMSVTDAIKKQDEERRKITSSKLENDLAEIAQKREAEIAGIGKQYSAEDTLRIKAAINARFDAEAAKAKQDAAEKTAKVAELAAARAERAAKKEEAAALKAGHVQAKIAAEKIRNASQDKLLALEKERLEAERLPSELARSQAILEIARKESTEKIALKKAELAVIQTDPKSTQADILRAQRDVAQASIDAQKEEYANLAQVARDKLAETEQAWRRGTGSVEEYRKAVEAAKTAGVIFADETNERLVASGNDMGAALSLGLQKAREKMQTDAEMMIYLGENIGDQIAGNLTSAWDSFANGTKTAKEAMIDFARSTLSWIGQIIIKQMILNALQSSGLVGNGSGSSSGILGAIGGAVASAFGNGGMVQALAGGGRVAGWSPSPKADNIPIWATAREFMQPVDAVDYYGEPFMEAVRRKLFPRNLARALAGGTMPRIPSGYRLAAGGSVPGQPPETTVKTGDVRLAVVNVSDESKLKKFLNSSEFDNILINRINRNGSTIKTIIR